MINAKTESLINIKEARNAFPNRASIATIWRWILRGLKGIKLESIKIGGRRYTSKEACERFMERTSDQGSTSSKSKRRTRATMRRSIMQANNILDQFGV